MTAQKDKDIQPYDDEEGLPPGPKRKGERLFGLLIVGTLLFNFPLLSIFSEHKLFLGYPVLFVYLFFIWGLIIGALALVLRARPRRSSGPDSAREKEDR